MADDHDDHDDPEQALAAWRAALELGFDFRDADLGRLRKSHTALLREGTLLTTQLADALEEKFHVSLAEVLAGNSAQGKTRVVVEALLCLGPDPRAAVTCALVSSSSGVAVAAAASHPSSGQAASTGDAANDGQSPEMGPVVSELEWLLTQAHPHLATPEKCPEENVTSRTSPMAGDGRLFE